MKYIKLFEQFLTEKSNDIELFIDVLTNFMEEYDEKSFAKFAKQYNVSDKKAKEMFNAYWDLSPMDRLNFDIEEWQDWLSNYGINESLLEKQFKGLDGIPANKELKDISKEQKLKIIKGTGNIIDFIVPKGVNRNFWQVIGTGKIKQNSTGQYYLEGKVINSPTFKSQDDLIDGVNWKSMEDRRQFNS